MKATSTPISRLSLPGPEDITRKVLSNGIVILSRSNFNSPSVLITGYLPAGGIYDPDEKLGLADFVASTLMRGLQTLDFFQIYDLLESAGASLGFGGGVHSIGFSGKALVEDLDLLLSLLAQALRYPVFPPEQVEKVRTQLLTSLGIRAQDTGMMASLLFDQITYAGHPYSRPEDGYPETILVIQPHDLQDFHKQHYGPRGLTIAIVGAVDPLETIEKVENVLGDWTNPNQATVIDLPALSRIKNPQPQRIAIPGKSQADILIGAAGPARSSPHFFPAMVGNNILGQFGMMGRVGEAVRERAGLAYYAASYLSGGTGPGPWNVAAGVDPENIDKSVEIILQEIHRFSSQPVSLEELADSQANFIGRLPLSLESNAGVAGALTNLERYQLGLDYYQRYPDLIKAVTTENILEAAQEFLNAHYIGIAIAGP
ncbi:MAG TPA: pitrilysin family protein [Anaerolineales bacterium]|nr:pitrilysin family protein [Anaerolineales bacterium]